MKRGLGLIFIILGTPYPAILGASLIDCIGNPHPINFHIPLLVLSIVFLGVGITLRPSLGKKKMANDKSKGNQPTSEGMNQKGN